jgi:phosphoribosyl-ATP pyrophosphohydrolase/phosphoribosyl-AMP cyclohydrolase/histidinol dehydrogenase
VWAASPRPAPATLAAAAVAGADGLLAVGGAQAIAALAFGIDGLSAVDFVCGPGNAWVTAAKRTVFGEVGIDMLAGPSELTVLADGGANAADVAADLLAQAEHDPRALPVLVTTEARVADEVDRELEDQRTSLPADVIGPALAGGFCVLVRDLDEGLAVCDRLAPEHLALHVANAAELEPRVRHAGAVFVGGDSAEVLGDYGAGPNHVLPTGRGARFRGGLSVLDFLRVRTWLALDRRAEAREVVEDAADLARVEGLEAHARSAERRRG